MPHFALRMHWVVFLGFVFLVTTTPSYADSVVFVYDRFEEHTNPAASVRLDQFEAHLNILKDYPVFPLPEVLEAIRSRKPLPDKTIVLTIDGTALSVWEQAIPRLKKAGFPFTIFVAPEQIDRQNAQNMSWDQLRALKKDGVTLGLTTKLSLSEGPENLRKLNKAIARFWEEFEEKPRYFSYSDGFYTMALQKLIKSRNFEAAFGRDLGVLSFESNRYAYPRFSMTESYANPERFRMAADAQALPVFDFEPSEMILNTPDIRFRVSQAFTTLDKLSCFAPDIGRLPVVIGDNNHVHIHFPATARKIQMHCILPNHDKKSYYWFGRSLFITD